MSRSSTICSFSGVRSALDEFRFRSRGTGEPRERERREAMLELVLTEADDGPSSGATVSRGGILSRRRSAARSRYF